MLSDFSSAGVLWSPILQTIWNQIRLHIFLQHLTEASLSIKGMEENIIIIFKTVQCKSHHKIGYSVQGKI